MKLATYQDGSRDGQLVVVSQDLSQAHYATHIAHHMGQLLDDWNFIAPQLEDLYADLNRGKAPYPFAFDTIRCMPVLPRPRDYLQGNAYEKIVTPDAQPSITSASTNTLVAPHSTLNLEHGQHTIDFEVGIALITEQVQQNSTPEAANACVRLVTLCANLLERTIPFTQPGHTSSYQTLLASSFGPVAVTTDELNGVWENGKLHLRLDLFLNGQAIARCPTDDENSISIGELLSLATQPHALDTSTLLYSGALLHHDESKGYTSLLLKHLREYGSELLSQPFTSGLQAGDTLRLETKGKDGQSLFGSLSLSLFKPTVDTKSNT